ncbi:MAG: hypothetical protein MJ186_04410, partial [Clostridia bacterium]|nr:hypothetical protein [Clostridia bacterium]
MWDYLSKTDRKIVLYGRGNAAERIMRELERRGKKPAGFFASDGFVRDKEFHGYPVRGYREAFLEFGADMIVLLCFGSHRDDVIENILHIAIETEFYAPDLPVIPEFKEDGSEILFTPQYKEEHEEQLQKVFDALADDQSRRVFQCVNKYRLTGKIQYLVNCETKDADNWALLDPDESEIYMDLGADAGDTVEEFIKYAGGAPALIYAVEPEERNFRKLSENTAGLENCRLINMAVSDKDEMVEF